MGPGSPRAPKGNAGLEARVGGLWANRPLGGTTGWRKVVDKPWSAGGAWRPGLTVDDVLLLHHLLLLLLQKAAVHGQAPRVGCEVPLVRLKVTHQLAVDHLCTWTSAGPTLSPTPLAGPRPPQAFPGPAVTFVDEGLHGQGPVPHVEGVRGLGQDPPQPQGGLFVEVSEGTGSTSPRLGGWMGNRGWGLRGRQPESSFPVYGPELRAGRDRPCRPPGDHFHPPRPRPAVPSPSRGVPGDVGGRDTLGQRQGGAAAAGTEQGLPEAVRGVNGRARPLPGGSCRGTGAAERHHCCFPESGPPRFVD